MAASIVSPVAGQLLRCLVLAGDDVAPDMEVAIVEAMKMHIPVSADRAGRVARWLVTEQSLVSEGQPLLVLEG